jgi:hypothetical protein
MGLPSLWWFGEKQIPFGNDRQKGKSKSKGKYRGLSAARLRRSGRDDGVFEFVGEKTSGG